MKKRVHCAICRFLGRMFRCGQIDRPSHRTDDRKSRNSLRAQPAGDAPGFLAVELARNEAQHKRRECLNEEEICAPTSEGTA